MNALLRDLAPVLPAAMARDLMGAAGPLPSRITYHAMLSSRDTGALGVTDCTTPAETLVPAHSHAEEDELCIVLSGLLEFRLPGRILRRRAGESLFIPRGTEHEVRALTESRHIAVLTRRSLES
ncbi:cupin domain-containing protein [Rubellimicrobium roseum]|uniref:Cupin domain-containing protein n=1 Tax=Rubellimicrobium roseum TaxID=687525 RepID=A0A5C4NE63_9RHOB|nr:cupin domain-containing protein [Rubellimicrobium roseum]TNC71638.1 cupin domain-containing protein [Rubellimicrobium roseum]